MQSLCHAIDVQRISKSRPKQIKNKTVIMDSFSKFSDISNEEMLLLQRVTATKISQMCRVYEKEYVLSDLISILKHRSTDEQDQIRVLAT
jgi:predicted metal-dependent phosphotriesterase family hydrolase